MIPGTQCISHHIHIYEQRTDTVQTAAANIPSRPADSQFPRCVCVCACILHPNVQSEMKGTTFLYTNEQCVRARVCHSHTSIKKYLMSSTHWIFNNNPLINNIIHVITFVGASFPTFSDYYSIFNSLVHSNPLHAFVRHDVFLNREMKTNFSDTKESGSYLVVSSNRRTQLQCPW